MPFSASSNALTNRAVSAFPLSIGTALAFESLFDGSQPPYDPERTVPERISINNYTQVWINVATLYRNILGAVDSSMASDLVIDDILAVLMEEIDTITDLVKTATYDKVPVLFYRSKYEGLKSAHPHANLRVDNTPKQVDYSTMQSLVLNHLYRVHAGDLGLHEYKRKLTPSGFPKALMITHVPYDLLSYKEFGELDLLESHTGVLKKRVAWHTKLQNGKDLTRIPFNACMMQVFGDLQTFHPMPIAARRLIMDLSNQYEWHALSTLDRLRFSFDSLKDRLLADLLKSMLSE
jgi:hypothetical protein